MGSLQFKQLPEQLVVLGVGNGRRVKHVVAIVVGLDVAAKRLRASAGPVRHPHQEKNRSASAPPGAIPPASMLLCIARSCVPIASNAAGPRGWRLSSTMLALS